MDKPQSFQEALELLALPPTGDVRRYIGVRSAWMPGIDLPLTAETVGPGKPLRGTPVAAYGGHVYAQAGLAACRLVEEDESDHQANGGTLARDKKLGLHVSNIHAPQLDVESSPVRSVSFDMKP